MGGDGRCAVGGQSCGEWVGSNGRCGEAPVAWVVVTVVIWVAEAGSGDKDGCGG